MKAEHRKELETNALADRMGRVVERIKHKPSGRGYLWLVLAAFVLAALFVFNLVRSTRQQEAALAWAAFEDADQKQLLRFSNIGKDPSDAPENVTKASRFQVAWHLVWEAGVKKLGADWRGSLLNLRHAEAIYSKLVSECEDDPVGLPEALYGLAIITETRAIQDRAKLKDAQQQFETLAKDHPKSAYGQLAEKRAAYIRDNFVNLELFYQNLQQQFRVGDETK